MVFSLRSWWRHYLEMLSALLSICEGTPPVIGGFSSHLVSLSTLLNKHSGCRILGRHDAQFMSL